MKGYSKEQIEKFKRMERDLASQKEGTESGMVVRQGPVSLVYTFVVPTRGGHYYLAVEADSKWEARAKAREVASSVLSEAKGFPSHLSTFASIDDIVLPKEFKERYREVGFAHMYKKK